MRKHLSLTCGLIFSLPVAAQVQPGWALVATRGANPATRLVQADLQTGALVALGRFPADGLLPLAVDIDPINLDVLLALDLGGMTRVVRLQMSGTSFVSETTLAEITGMATQLSIGPKGEPIASFGGPDGKIVRIPRNGGPVELVAHLPYTVAMTDFGFTTESALVVQSDASNPMTSYVELNTGQVIHGPDVVPVGPALVTGVFDFPTAVPRQLLTREDGTIVLHSPFVGVDPMVLQITPQLPPGGAVAMRGTLEIKPIVLGGMADPYLRTFDLFAAPLQWEVLAGPLPDDPVDYVVSPGDSGTVLNFGVGCGLNPPSFIWGNSGGRPQLGNQGFTLTLSQGAPFSQALLALGFDDRHALGTMPLPFTLPSGCDLLVSPDHVVYHTTNGFGQAQQVIPVPNQTALLGLTVYAQWFQDLGVPFATSNAAAIRVAN